MSVVSEIKWHQKDIKEVFREIESSENGLKTEEAEKRITQYGYNEIKKEKTISKLDIMISQFKNFLIIILIAATFFSFVIGEMIDAIAILVIVILNAIFGFVQEYKAEKTIEALKKLSCPVAVVMRDDKEQKIDSKFLVPGDVVILEEGSRVPADVRIIKEFELKVDESMLTGESVAVSKDVAVVKGEALGDRKNIAYMGTLVTYGRALGVVVSTGNKTEIGKIAQVVQEAGEELTPLQKKLDKFGKKLGMLILVICAAVVIIGLLRGGPLIGQDITTTFIITMVITGIALAVAAIPEGLPAVITITLALGLQRLAKHNALMRKLPAVETLGSTTIICSDKTGTLTKNEMTISNIWVFDNEIEVTGKGYSPKGRFLLKGKELNKKIKKSLNILLRTGTLCTNASLDKKSGEYSIIGDPTEGAIVVAANKIGILKEKINSEFERLHEIPFSSERKMMTTINKNGKKMISCVKGAPEVVLGLCTMIYDNGKPRKMTQEDMKKILSVNRDMTSDALRVIAISYGEFTGNNFKKAEKNLTFIGLVGMIDPPREEVVNSIKECEMAGIKTVMITGDHKNTAVAIGKTLGLMKDGDNVITGPELDDMSDSEFQKIVSLTRVYARVNPIHKLRIVEALKKDGNIIAMTGDGVNDAPALKKAEIGIAMGIKGTDVSKEASDMILTDDNFASIVRAVQIGRGIYDNMKKFIQYLLSSNVGEVMIVFMALLIGFQDPGTLGLIIPVTAIQLLWINLLTDGLPALALGLDPASPGIMKRPPRDPHESILTRSMFIDIIFFGVLMCASTLLLFAINLPNGGTFAITVAFTSVVMFEMVRVQSVRSKYRIGLFSNKKLILAVVISIALQLVVIYVPFFNPIFETTTIGIIEWGQIILASIVIFFIMWFKGKIIREKVWD